MGKQLSAIARNDYEEIMNILITAKADADKFYYKGNKLAGTRLRKAYLKIQKLCVESRANVQLIKSQNPPASKKQPANFL
jgi:hypothetical protein